MPMCNCNSRAGNLWLHKIESLFNICIWFAGAHKGKQKFEAAAKISLFILMFKDEDSR